MWKIVIFLSFLAHFVHCAQVVPVESAPRNNLAVSVIWDNCTQSTYWTDLFTEIGEKCLYRWDYTTNTVYGASIPNYSAAAFIIRLGECNNNRIKKFVVGLGRDADIVEWDGISEEAEYIGPVFAIPDTNTTNHMAVSHQSLSGHFYGGSYDPVDICGGARTATAFKYTTAGGVREFDSGLIDVSGWAFFDNKAILIDTCDSIKSYDENCDSNCQATTVFNFREKLDHYLVGLQATSEKQLLTCDYTDGSVWLIDPITQTADAIAKLPFGGCGGICLVGPQQNMLVAILGSTVINPANPKEIVANNNASSLYKILGVDFTALPSANLNF